MLGMEAAKIQMEAMSGPTRRIQFRTDAEQEEAFAVVHDEWWGAFEAAADLPAQTHRRGCAQWHAWPS
jgi:hypothetical protein